MARVAVTVGASRQVQIALEPVEVGLLASLAAQVADFVAPDADVDPLVALVGIDPAASVPADPALRRLLPDAYADDAEASARFRQFTERDLRERKRAAALFVLGAVTDVDPDLGGSIVFEAGQTDAWLGFLTDARLTLGARLGVTEDNYDELAAIPDEDPRSGMFAVYDWLTYLQDATVTGLLGDV